MNTVIIRLLAKLNFKSQLFVKTANLVRGLPQGLSGRGLLQGAGRQPERSPNQISTSIE